MIQATTSAKCSVRDVILDIRYVHPELRPDVSFMPSRVLVRKCTGCCSSELAQCAPTSTYATQMQISRHFVTTGRFDFVTLNFTHHETCSCSSSPAPSRCAWRDCGARRHWDATTCRCECNKCHVERLVHMRFEQNPLTCACSCRFGSRIRANCSAKRSRFRHEVCRCDSSQLSRSRNKYLSGSRRRKN